MGVFCTVNDYVGKADLGKDNWNPKRKLGAIFYYHTFLRNHLETIIIIFKEPENIKKI